MTWDRGVVVDHQLISMLKDASEAGGSPPPPSRALHEPLAPASELTGALFLELLESQFTSRHLDLIARELRSRDAAFYTIGSTGHEGNVVIAGDYPGPSAEAMRHLAGLLNDLGLASD